MSRTSGLNLDKAIQIEGWMSYSELEWLASTAKMSDIIVEVGCYRGRSTRAICDNTRALIFAVDPWEDIYFDKNGKSIGILKKGSFEEFNSNLKEFICSGQLEVMKCKSDDFPDLGNGFANFIFLDGDHRYEQVVKDIMLAEKVITRGGIIAGHDYTHSDWPGVKQAVDEFYPTAQKVDSIWWTVKT